LIPLDVEIHLVAVLQRTVSVALDHAEMHENILSGLRVYDEPEPLLVIEPLYCSFRHVRSGIPAEQNNSLCRQWKMPHGARQKFFGNNFVTNETTCLDNRIRHGNPHGPRLVRLKPERTILQGGSKPVATIVTGPAEGIAAAAAILDAGEVVALPTETVYGLGAAALDPAACARIFEVKDRPLSDPLIVHLPSREWLDRVAVVSPVAFRLAEKFWPGPLTLVLPRLGIVPDLVTAGQETVAVRMSAHPVFSAVLQAYGKPVAAPSANRFGRISPTSADDVVAELGGRIPLVIDGGPCEHGIESTIVLVQDSELHILRNGPVTAEELAAFGTVRGQVAGISAPGGLASHYAPRTPLVIGEPVPSPKTGLLSWQTAGEGFAQVEYLSKSHDLREAAANLYGAMRRLDAAGLDLIIAEPVPESGLGRAIMERLKKAAAR